MRRPLSMCENMFMFDHGVWKKVDMRLAFGLGRDRSWRMSRCCHQILRL